MSISSLANAAAARREDFQPIAAVPHGLAGIAAAAAGPLPVRVLSASDWVLPAFESTPAVGSPAPTPADGSPAGQTLQAGPPAEPANAVNTTLHVMFGYIPTEVLTLYVAILAAVHQPNKITQTEWSTFWVFLVATPIVVWLVYAAKVTAEKKPLPLNPSQWPFWEIFAATVAFFAWAFALPNTAFSAYPWYASAIAGVIVLVASTVLGLLAPLFQRTIKTGAAAT